MSSNLHKKGSEVSTKTVFSFKGQATKHTTVKWSIASLSIFETASFAQAFNRESRVSHNSKHKTVFFDWNFMRNHEYSYLLQSFIPDLFETVYGIIKFILTPPLHPVITSIIINSSTNYFNQRNLYTGSHWTSLQTDFEISFS